MAKEIRTEIKIMARPEQIWSILLKTEAYPNWNPFIKSITGTIEIGKSIEVIIHAPERDEMKFHPKIISLLPNKELVWLGHLGFKGIFDGKHSFIIINNGDGSSTFIHKEQFSGILVPFFKKMLDYNTRNGFAAMNLKLKEQVEKNK